MRPTRVIIGILAILLLLAVKDAWPQRESATTIRSWQWGDNRNASQSGSNSVIEATVAAINGQRVFLHAVSARCTTGPPLVTIRDGILSNASVRTFTYIVGSPSIVNFSPAWTTRGSQALYVSMATCLGDGRIDIQADQW